MRFISLAMASMNVLGLELAIIVMELRDMRQVSAIGVSGKLIISL